MKLRSKLLLSATCLLTISVAATATSAYAWFTANRQAFVSVTGMSVKSDVDEVFIQEVKKDNSVTKAAKTVTLTAPDITTDVSGDGKTMYKPSFKDVNASAANSVAEVGSSGTVDKKTVYYFNEFTLKFTKENPNVTTGLFFSCTSSIKKANGTKESDPDLSGAYRVAVLDSTKNTLLAYYAPYDAAADLEYIHTKELGAGNAIQTQEVTAEHIGLTDNYVNNLLDSTFRADITDADEPSESKINTLKSYLGTIPSGQTGLTLVVRIWCEGTDDECNNNTLSGKVDVNLVFNGVTMVPSVTMGA